MVFHVSTTRPTARMAEILTSNSQSMLADLGECFTEGSISIGTIDSYQRDFGATRLHILAEDGVLTISVTGARSETESPSGKFSIKVPQHNQLYSGPDEIPYLEPKQSIINGVASANGSLFPYQQRARVNIFQVDKQRGLLITSVSVMLITESKVEDVPYIVLRISRQDREEALRFSIPSLIGKNM